MAAIPVRIRDGCFTDHAHGFTLGGDNIMERPRYIEWVKVGHGEPATFYTDVCLQDAVGQPGFKVALLIEPPGGNRTHYDAIEELQAEFDYILTFRKDLCRWGKWLYYPLGGSWVDQRATLYPYEYKTGTCMFVSNKRLSPAHELRHAIASVFRDIIDVYGEAVHRPIASKSEALCRSRYAVIVEAWRGESYFSEKLIDALQCWTVPIYCGCPDIGNFFDERGIITFQTVDELGDILDGLNDADWQYRQSSIERNRQLAQGYRIAEDWIFENYPFLFDENKLEG